MAYSPKEQEIIDVFVGEVFGAITVEPISEEEMAVVEECKNYVEGRFSGMRYILGLALDFTILAQKLSGADHEMKEFTPDLETGDIFSRYTLVEARGSRKSNTLTLAFNGELYGIRKFEENVANLFHSMDRSDYPSAYVYNTGQWQKYIDLLTSVFMLSESGKYILLQNLIEYGMHMLPKNSFFVREFPRVRLYEKVISEYERGAKGENGGLVYQAIAYGFLAADRPHLSIIADKVRTGSSRQKRFGDIDCYGGLDLETSVEVKDFNVTDAQFAKELSEFCRNCEGNNINGIVFARAFDTAVFETIRDCGVKAITQESLLELVSYWDWEKQDAALKGALHYLAHIEQNPLSVTRLLTFIRSHDPEHDALNYLR
tara:strand:+ start:66743 stop:67861 length:1119 start_codon:yes stop_codon:yes gene_type:complete